MSCLEPISFNFSTKEGLGEEVKFILLNKIDYKGGCPIFPFLKH